CGVESNFTVAETIDGVYTVCLIFDEHLIRKTSWTVSNYFVTVTPHSDQQKELTKWQPEKEPGSPEARAKAARREQRRRRPVSQRRSQRRRLALVRQRRRPRRRLRRRRRRRRPERAPASEVLRRARSAASFRRCPLRKAKE